MLYIHYVHLVCMCNHTLHGVSELGGRMILVRMHTLGDTTIGDLNSTKVVDRTKLNCFFPVSRNPGNSLSCC